MSGRPIELGYRLSAGTEFCAATRADRHTIKLAHLHTFNLDTLQVCTPATFKPVGWVER